MPYKEGGEVGRWSGRVVSPSGVVPSDVNVQVSVEVVVVEGEIC